MEQKMMEVLRRMQNSLSEEQLRELQSVLYITFGNCELVEHTELMVKEKTWIFDLEDFIMSKVLEGRSETTLNRYKYELNRLLSYTNKPVDHITSADISRYLHLYKKTRNISNQTLKNVRAVFSSFFGWLRERDRIAKNPMVLVEEISVDKKILKPFSDIEREKLKRACTELRDLAMLEFMYSTAIRVSELISLNRDDIRFGDADLIVYGKGGKERTVYLNDKTCMYLKEYLASRNDDNPALFVSVRTPHQRLSKTGVEYMIRTLGQRAGVEKAYPHRFRRTSLTNVLNRGMPLQEAMLMAGHSKPETTMRYCSIAQEGVKYHHKKYLSA